MARGHLPPQATRARARPGRRCRVHPGLRGRVASWPVAAAELLALAAGAVTGRDVRDVLLGARVSRTWPAAAPSRRRPWRTLRLVGDLMRDHGPDRMAEALAAVRGEQGLPVTAADPLLQDAIARGLLLAPAVELPNGTLQPFATLPYILDRELLRGRKPVLDKALAVLACLRCGQHFGGATSLSASGPVNVIDKLLDPNQGFLQPHSLHERQYRLMYSAGLLAFDPDPMPGGSWVQPRFIDTDDNRQALRIARDLIIHGERLAGRVGDDQARNALLLGQPFAAPMQTVARMRDKAITTPRQWQAFVDAALSRGRIQ